MNRRALSPLVLAGLLAACGGKGPAPDAISRGGASTPETDDAQHKRADRLHTDGPAEQHVTTPFTPSRAASTSLDPPGVIAGTISWSKGPLHSAHLTAESASQQVVSNEVTGSSGEYQLAGLASGTYRVHLRVGSLHVIFDHVEVTEGRETVVNHSFPAEQVKVGE